MPIMIAKLLLLSFGFVPQKGQDHPLAGYYRRQADGRNFKPVIVGSSLGAFLLFGSLSLPFLYLLISLVIAIYLSAGTAWRIHSARSAQVWDLVCVSPLAPRDILLTTWLAGVGQLRQTHLLILYRLLHAFILIGILILSILFGEMSPEQGLIAVIGGTLLMIFQPAVEMYFSGMIGLLCANRIRDRAVSVGIAGLTIISYWIVYVAGVLLVAFSDLKHLQAVTLLVFFTLLLIIPLVIGRAAQHMAEKAL